MHIGKVGIFILAGFLALAGCVNAPAGTSEEEVNDLRNELAASKADQQALRKQYIEQNEELSAILNELAAISGKTASLRLDVESGSARMTQADRITTSIEGIKARIAALEKSNSVMSGKNKEFKDMIEGFNKVIEEQELQIATLKDQIKGMGDTIKAQKDTITTQNNTILQQKKDLERTVAEQAKMLCDAGIALEEIADNAPQVSWKKNKEKVGAMAQTIYRKALTYYRQSYDAGYAPAKDHIASVNAKIEAQ